MDITMTEWKEQQSRLAQEVQRRWPWLYKPWATVENSLRVECHAMSASVDLRTSGSHSRCESFSVDVRVDSSSTCTGGPADVAEFVRQVSEVRDFMLFIHGATRDLRVWMDGECPCSRCSGCGTSRGQACAGCNGKGKR